VLGDRGYDAAAIRRGLRARHIVPLLAMRRTEHGSGQGRWRWVMERTFAWLSQFRRLRVRYDKRADIHEAFLSLGCALMLAVAAQDLKPMPSFPALVRQTKPFSCGIASIRLLGGRWGQALGIGLHYGVTQELTSSAPSSGARILASHLDLNPGTRTRHR